MTVADDKITREGEGLVVPWLRARKRVAELNAQLGNAEREEEMAASALTVFLVPEDAKVGEKFCVWYLDGLIQLEIMPPPQSAEITVRKRGRRMDAAT